MLQILSTVKSYLSQQFFCEVSDLDSSKTIFTINSLSDSPYIKIMAFKGCTIISTCASLHSKIKTVLSGRNKDEIFEFPLVYGQTIHYIPDIKNTCDIQLLDEYAYELLQGHAIKELAGITGFDNSLLFDSIGVTSTEIVYLARKNNEIVGMAGASKETEVMWEVGVDVLPEHQRKGLGSKLVSKLTGEMMSQGIVPFYSASITNIASQMVAYRSGYMPCWIDTFGSILDGSSPYDSLVKEIHLLDGERLLHQP